MNKKTALIFFGIIGIGAVISVLTLTNFGERVEVPEEAGPVEVGEISPKPVAEEKTPAPQPAVPEEKEVEPAEPKVPEPQPAPVVGFSSPEEAMRSLAAKVGAKNYSEFAAAVGEETIPESIRGRVKELIEDPSVELDAERPFSEISKSANAVRWALNFVPEGGGGAQQLYTDLSPAEEDEKILEVAKLSFPLVLSELEREDSPVSPGSGATASPDAAPSSKSGMEEADALTIAHAFSKAIVDREFEAARALSDPSQVTDERVAALMIAVEEGKFSLKQDRPLVVTLSREDITWVLTRVSADQTESEFALELGRVGEAWKVNGLTFSKVLSALSAQAGGGDVAYSPIVEDPAGGDSLVLYFEFDNAGLTERTRRQLAIVADILGKGTDRVIRINGHADAKGTDAYNAKLSDGRASSVREALISMGVSPEQIVTEGFGASKPRLPNFLPDGSDNPSGRSQNRRAEVYLDF